MFRSSLQTHQRWQRIITTVFRQVQTEHHLLWNFPFCANGHFQCAFVCSPDFSQFYQTVVADWKDQNTRCGPSGKSVAGPFCVSVCGASVSRMAQSVGERSMTDNKYSMDCAFLCRVMAIACYKMTFLKDFVCYRQRTSVGHQSVCVLQWITSGKADNFCSFVLVPVVRIWKDSLAKRVRVHGWNSAIRWLKQIRIVNRGRQSRNPGL